jgi:hypothetical protein
VASAKSFAATSFFSSLFISLQFLIYKFRIQQLKYGCCMTISNLLVTADNISNYIPFVSTITNIVDIFLKCVVIPRLERENIPLNHYFTHLQKKSLALCIILLVPVLGNIAIGLHNLRLTFPRDNPNE